MDTFAHRPPDSWDEAVGSGGYNALTAGDFCNEGNEFEFFKKPNLKRVISYVFAVGLQ